ncbi:hypothetical protein ID866_8421 [Astraeus odoratus]|nr:hypothetical protein ID866_8421 [Astraeus odoratus]
MPVDTGKAYHKQTAGAAFETAQTHAADQEITLFDEVDPYKKPKELVELSPKCLVPALRLSNYNPARALNESTVILEYLDLASASTKRSLLTPSSHSYARALVRLQSDHINRTLVPAFHRYLQVQDPGAQIAGGQEFLDAVECFKDGDLGLADVLVGPSIFRETNVLKHYRGLELPPRA